jgi:hypothetical protein
MERCHREIASIEAEILAGNPNLPGLCLALSDWSAELRMIQQEQPHRDALRGRGNEPTLDAVG